MSRRVLNAILAGVRVGRAGLVNLAQLAGFFGGLAAISAGVAMIYRPAGVIVAGVLLAGSVVAYVRGAGR